MRQVAGTTIKIDGYNETEVAKRLGKFGRQSQEALQHMPGEELQIKSDIPRVGLEGGRVPPDVQTAIQRAHGGGQPLEGALQKQMSATLGHDFREVRFHIDSHADDLARALGARAFTVGRDIFFSEGSWEPDSTAGRGLIAHELSHVAQQSAGWVPTGGGRLVVRPANDVFEWEAERVAASVASGGRLDVGAASGLRPHRSRPSLTVQRTAATFAQHARIGPLPAPGPAPAPHKYNCHMSALYWAFRDLGDTAIVARDKIEAIASRECPACGRGGAAHGSISNTFYGTHLCSAADPVIANRAALAGTAIGDVLWVGDARSPAHSMVLVAFVNIPNNVRQVYIRGFNNWGTLGAGPGNQYDNQDRNIEPQRYWHTLGVNTRFGVGYLNDRVLHRIDFTTFAHRASIVRGWITQVGGQWVFEPPLPPP
jgi:hypothetical protein